MGLVARTVDGEELGTVTEVLHNPGGELLVVARAGARTSSSPSCAPSFPPSIPAAGLVIIDPPPGLLEL